MLESAARQGSAVHAAQLDGPPFPECLRYLYDWALELVGRSGVGMSGYAPLSPSVLRDWARARDVRVHPHEVPALFALDRALRTPRTTMPTEDDA